MIKTYDVLIALAIVWLAATYLPKWQEDRDWRENARTAVASQFTDQGQWQGMTCKLRLSYSADGVLMFVGSDDPDAAFCNLASTAGVRAADKHLIPLPPARLRSYEKANRITQNLNSRFRREILELFDD